MFTNNIELELIEEILNKKKEFKFRALGTSMFPLIRDGDLISIKPIDSNFIFIGDVLLLKKGNQLFLHRLIQKKTVENKIHLITKGDCLNYTDSPFNLEDLLGKAVSIERNNHVISLDTYRRKKIGNLISNHPTITYAFFRAYLLINTIIRASLIKIYLRINDFSLFRKIKKKNTDNIIYVQPSSLDFPLLAQFHNLSENELFKLINDGCSFLIAKDKEKIIGSIAVYKSWKYLFNDENLWITKFQVSPFYRNQGIGTSLVKEILELSKRKGFKEVYLSVSENNKAAIKIYSDVGFKETHLETGEKIKKHFKKYNINSKYVIMKIKLNTELYITS